MLLKPRSRLMYFYQIDRINLTRVVEKHANYITGRTLDVGAGPHRRYSFPKATEYMRMDLEGVPNLDVIGKAEEIPFPDNSFESIVFTQTFAGIFDLKAAFSEMARVLKPGGHFLLTTQFILDRQDTEHQYFHPSDNALRRLCDEAGMETIILEGCGGYHSAIFQLRERYLLRKYRLRDRWFSRGLSFLFKVFGTIAIYLDERQPEMKRHYTDNWFLLAKKR